MHIIKPLLTLIFLLGLATPSYSQMDPKSAAERIPTELKLPTRKETGKKQLSGKYTFVVETDGSLSNVLVKDSMGYGIDEQIVNRLSQTKKWKVVVVGGEKMRIGYSLPITVILDKK